MAETQDVTIVDPDAEGGEAIFNGDASATDDGPSSLSEAYDQTAEEPADGEVEPTAQGETPTGGEQQPAPTDEPKADDTERYAEFGRRLSDQFGQDPVQAVAQLARLAMATDPDVGKRLAAELGLTRDAPETPAADFDPSTYEPASDLEAALLPHVSAVRELPRFAQDVGANFEALALHTRALHDTVQALTQALEIELPVFDPAKVLADRKDGDTAAAYERVYGSALKTATETARQSVKARRSAPQTLRQGTSAPAPRKEPANIMEMYAQVSSELGAL